MAIRLLQTRHSSDSTPFIRPTFVYPEKFQPFIFYPARISPGHNSATGRVALQADCFALK